MDVVAWRFCILSGMSPAWGSGFRVRDAFFGVSVLLGFQFVLMLESKAFGGFRG